MDQKDFDKLSILKNKLIEYEELLIRIKNNDFDKIINKNKIGIIYNYIPGEIFIFLFDSKENSIIKLRESITDTSILPYNLDKSELTAVSIDKYFLFGTKLGSIMLYIQGKKNIEKIIHHHTQKILYIEQNNILNIMISSSKDGYINMYTTPNLQLIRSIYFKNFLGDYILISYSPLPSFLIYNKEKESFKSYSINGRYLLKNDKKIKDVHKPKIVKAEYYKEYLRINENSSNLYELPYLEQINLNNIYYNLDNFLFQNQNQNQHQNNNRYFTRKKNKILKTLIR